VCECPTGCSDEFGFIRFECNEIIHMLAWSLVRGRIELEMDLVESTDKARREVAPIRSRKKSRGETFGMRWTPSVGQRIEENKLNNIWEGVKGEGRSSSPFPELSGMGFRR